LENVTALPAVNPLAFAARRPSVRRSAGHMVGHSHLQNLVLIVIIAAFFSHRI
jgi:hypothetical protein